MGCAVDMFKLLKSRSLALALLAVTLAACGAPGVATPVPQATVSGAGSLLVAGQPTSVASPAGVTPAATARATATPTPVPSPAARQEATLSLTAQATPTAAASAPPAGAPEVSALAQEAMDRLTALTEQMSPRASATDQEKAAADYLAAQFQALGYEARLEPFTVELTSGMLSVVPSRPETQNVDVLPLSRSGLGDATGEVVFVGRAMEGDVPSEGLQGKVALIERGTITFQEKVARVADAGAIAAVVYNNVPGLFGGALSEMAPIPVISISREVGEAIRTLLEQGSVQADVSVSGEVRESRNVIAEKPGTAGDGRVVVLGGHYDTVPGVPGANDNGSGTATVLTIASAIRDRAYPFTIRFMAFGSEELGLHGSRAYVGGLTEEDRQRHIAMLNFDALGTSNVTGVLGSDGLIEGVRQAAERLGIQVQRHFSLGNASSDHAPFLQAEIPVVFFLGDDFSRIHTPEDRLEFVQPELMGNAAALTIALLDSLSSS